MDPVLYRRNPAGRPSRSRLVSICRKSVVALLCFHAARTGDRRSKKSPVAEIKPHSTRLLRAANKDRAVCLLFDNDMGDSILSQAEIDALLNEQVERTDSQC